jgi:sulfite oxidase
VQIIDSEGEVAMVLTLDELKSKFAKHSVTATMQCAGNRRAEMHAAREVKGLQWDNRAISTATWTGVKLSDILKQLAIKAGPGARHVQFIGLDCDVSGV